MAVQFNHTIVLAKDKHASAAFLAEILGRPAPKVSGPFVAVQLDNGVTLDYADADVDFPVQHLAFLVGEDEFDEIHRKITERGLVHWADPHRRRPNEINTHDGGRGVYFLDPDGHALEAITVPYGGLPG
ncbi:VOC family protein [Actinokineospora inagensis]|uniref:VOC family protein n=1 Tax=Actinokineospora inagensis TaxID=103730 RepID=UPI0004086EC7|nr:VOC family protein [Actinokineospora inagensis]